MKFSPKILPVLIILLALVSIAFAAPSITITEPKDFQIIYENNVSVVFESNESTPLNCTVFLYFVSGELNASFPLEITLSGSAIFPIESVNSYVANVTCTGQEHVLVPAPNNSSNISNNSNQINLSEQINSNYLVSSTTVEFLAREMPNLILVSPENGFVSANSEQNFSFAISSQSLMNESYILIRNCSIIVDDEYVYSGSVVENNNVALNLSEGRHIWSLECILNSGYPEDSGQAILSEERSILIDYSAPVIEMLLPGQNFVSDASTVPFSIHAFDSASENISCSFSGITAPAFTILNDSYYNFTLPLSAGNYSYSVSCFDLGNNTVLLNNRSIDVIRFSLIINSSVYLPEEPVLIYLSAPISSRVNITISNSNSTVSYLTNPPYPTTYIFPSTTNPGNYSIRAVLNYLNATFERNVSFSVIAYNNISVQINASNITAESGAPVRFFAIVSGNRGALSYSWDFNGDGISESQLANATYSYSIPGEYTAKLSVSDRYNSKSAEKTIKVIGRFNLSVNVKDLSGNGLAANISIGNATALSNASGFALITQLLEGSYSFKVNKDGYDNYSSNLAINSNKNITVYLNSLITPPDIQIISPANGAFFESGTVPVKFRVIHEFKLNCTLYVNEDGNWWSVAGTASELSNNTEAEITAAGLSSGDKHLKLYCADQLGNSNYKEITVSIAVSNAGSNNSGNDIVPELQQASEQLSSLRSYYDSLPQNERTASEVLGIIKNLEDAEASLDRASRDINDLAYSKKSDEELLLRKSQIINDTLEKIALVPNLISVEESSEFVKYPSADNLLEIADAFISSKGLKIDSKTFERANADIQEALSVKTRVSKVTLSSNGSDKTILLLHSEFTISRVNESGLSNLAIVMFVPKNITDDSDKITFLSDITVLRADPVIELPLSQNLTCYFNENIDAVDIQSIDFFLVQKSATVANPLTGFSVSETKVIWPFNLLKGKSPSFVIQIIIVVVLLTIYAGYSLKPELVSRPITMVRHKIAGIHLRNPSTAVQMGRQFERHETHGMNEMHESHGRNERAVAAVPVRREERNLPSAVIIPEVGPTASMSQFSYMLSSIGQVQELLISEMYEEASMRYYELKLMFSILPEESKKVVYPQLIAIFNQLNLSYIRGQLSNAKKMVDAGMIPEAAFAYSKIEKAYGMLPKDYKHYIFMDCFRLVKILDENSEMIEAALDREMNFSGIEAKENKKAGAVPKRIQKGRSKK